MSVAQAGSKITIQVAQGTDDASETPDPECPFNFGANEAYIGECPGGEPIVAGFRFVTEPDFPEAAMIQEAHLELTVDGPYSNPMEVRIFGARFDYDPFDVSPPSARLRTQAFTSWFITEHWEWTEKRNSPDISHVIREIISLPDWDPGDPIVIIITSLDAQRTHRRFFGWERDPLTAAKLVVNDPAPEAPGAGDRDGDGLLDKWETDGYDHNADGRIDVDLPALGADPDTPDIFVQADWLEEGGLFGHTHRPSQAIIDKVVQSFATNGITNINLHVQFGNAIPETDANRALGVDDGSFFCDYDWSAFQQLKDIYFVTPTPERLPIYHYMIFAHDIMFTCGRTGPSGISRNIIEPLDPNFDKTFHGGASDFIVSLGVPPLFAPYFGDLIGGTFMHELGHNLGLGHGGVRFDGNTWVAEHAGFKPNYLSVMNYRYQGGFFVNAIGLKALDYASFSSSLDEAALDETKGVSTGGITYFALAEVTYDCWLPWDPIVYVDFPADWDCDFNDRETSVSENIDGADDNGDGQKNILDLSILEHGVDWEHLTFTGGAIGALGFTHPQPVLAAVHLLPEATVEELVEQSRSQVAHFVVLGEEGVWLKQGSQIVSGDIAANTASPGPFLDSGKEVVVGESVQLLNSGSLVIGDSIRVKQGSQIYEAGYNDLDGNGTVLGPHHTPLQLPLVTQLPVVPTFSPGTQSFDVPQNGSLTLDVGSYGTLLARKGSTVTFTGGTYDFAAWDIRDDVKLYVVAPTEIRIQGRLDTDLKTYLGPAPSATDLNARDIKVFVIGQNGNTGALGGTPKAAEIGERNTIVANIYAPNGTLWLKQGTTATGAFFGKWVIVGEQVIVALENGF